MILKTIIICAILLFIWQKTSNCFGSQNKKLRLKGETNMKKNFKILALLLVAVFAFSSCQEKTDVDTKKENESNQQSTNKEDESKKTEGKKTVTVSSSFIYDMVYQLIGDKAEIKLIVPAGIDPHTYVAKPADVEKITEADLLLYHGLHFEGKMKEILEKTGVAVSKNFDPADLIGEGAEVDPHFWFDLKLYKQAVEVAAEELKVLLPDSASEIDSKLVSYKKELDELGEYITKKVKELPDGKVFLITPHDAFSYFAREYGVTVHAPQGISTESEVSTQDITETVNFIVDNKVKAIFAESTTSPERMQKLQESVKEKGFEIKVVSGEGKELHSDSLEELGKSLDQFIPMYKHNVDLIVDNLK